MRTIRLGDSAFIKNEEIFLPMDIDGERKFLQKQGAVNGKTNSPNSKASRPDDVEHGIIQKILQTVQQTQVELSQHFVGFHSRLLPIVETWDAQALINYIQSMPKQVKNALNDILRQFEAESAIQGPKWRHAQKDYEKFRKDNELIRPADYSSKRFIIFWVGGLIILEAGLNATLLWELTGFLLAFGQTILIAVVNVLLGASAMGWCLCYTNHISSKIRRLAVLFISVILLAVLVFNFGVGHYRDALVDAKVQAEQLLTSPDWDDASSESINLGFVDYTQKAMESITQSFFTIESVLSGLLIIVGIGFFGISTYKWYSMRDSYPGYQKRDIMLKKAHTNYIKLEEKTRTKIKSMIEDSIMHVSDEDIKVTNMRKQYNELINRANTLKKSYVNWSVTAGQTQTTLLEVYRNNNRKARSEPDPEYFNNEIPIDSALTEPPTFDPPKLGDMDVVVKTVKLAKKEINMNADQIWERFNELANMQHQTDNAMNDNDYN